jgi:transcription antitermination factor NusG
MEKQLEANWYAFYTRSRAEKQLYNRLAEKNYEVFLPLITRIRLWSDRKKRVKEPLIRSYVFVRIGEKHIFEVLKVPGTVGVLKHLGKPAVVRDHEIENLRILVSGEPGAIDQVDGEAMEKGDAIEVVQGSFAGLLADYVRMKGKYRVIVRIKTLGAVLSVDIPRKHIKKLKN